MGRLGVFVRCDIARTYAATSRAANRGLRAEGIPRLPPINVDPGRSRSRLWNSEKSRQRAGRRNRKGSGVRTQSQTTCTPTQTREWNTFPAIATLGLRGMMQKCKKIFTISSFDECSFSNTTILHYLLQRKN